jgi:hypothetical protein
MNDKIKELAIEANLISPESNGFDSTRLSISQQKFAELIVRECIGQCQREWYDLNNTKPVENETARDIGIRVGQKTGVLKCINQINKHFGVEE